MPKVNLIFFLFIFFVAISCSNKSIPTTNKTQEVILEIDEDLSVYRNLDPQITSAVANKIENEVEPKLTDKPLYINDKVDAYLDEKAAKNKNVKYANGYRIQLYVGRERKLVDEAKIYIYQTYPNINPYLTYSLPIYKLKIGDFITRTEAERLLNQLKPHYPEAIIIPEKIDVKKSFAKE